MVTDGRSKNMGRLGTNFSGSKWDVVDRIIEKLFEYEVDGDIVTTIDILWVK